MVLSLYSGSPQDAHVQFQNVYVFSLNSLAELEDRSRSGARNAEQLNSSVILHLIIANQLPWGSRPESAYGLFYSFLSATFFSSQVGVRPAQQFWNQLAAFAPLTR